MKLAASFAFFLAAATGVENSTAQYTITDYVYVGQGLCTDSSGHFYSYIRTNGYTPHTGSVQDAAEAARYCGLGAVYNPTYVGFYYYRNLVPPHSGDLAIGCLFSGGSYPAPIPSFYPEPDTGLNSTGTGLIQGVSTSSGTYCYKIEKTLSPNTVYTGAPSKSPLPPPAWRDHALVSVLGYCVDASGHDFSRVYYDSPWPYSANATENAVNAISWCRPGFDDPHYVGVFYFVSTSNTLHVNCLFSDGLPLLEVPSQYQPRHTSTEARNGTGLIAGHIALQGTTCFKVANTLAPASMPPTSAAPVTNPPTYNPLVSYTFVGTGQCLSSSIALYSQLHTDGFAPFTGTANDEIVAANWCSSSMMYGNYVGFELYRNDGALSTINLSINCLFAGAFPSPLPAQVPPSSGQFPQAGMGQIASVNNISPPAKCYKIANTLSPVTISPTTHSPVTTTPTTNAPATIAPTSHSPVIAAATGSPTSFSPVTVAPTSHSPVTTSPTTHAPITTVPVTVAPNTFNVPGSKSAKVGKSTKSKSTNLV